MQQLLDTRMSKQHKKRLCHEKLIVLHNTTGCDAGHTPAHLQRPLTVVDGDPLPTGQPLHLLQSPARLAIRGIVHCTTQTVTVLGPRDLTSCVATY